MGASGNFEALANLALHLLCFCDTKDTRSRPPGSLPPRIGSALVCGFYTTLIFTLLCNRASFGDSSGIECCSEAIDSREVKRPIFRRSAKKSAHEKAWGLESRAMPGFFMALGGPKHATS